MHIHDIGFDIAEMLVRFGLLDKSSFIHLCMFQALICEKGIALPAHGLSNMILREPMDEIDIGAQQILESLPLVE